MNHFLLWAAVAILQSQALGASWFGVGVGGTVQSAPPGFTRKTVGGISGVIEAEHLISRYVTIELHGAFAFFSVRNVNTAQAAPQGSNVGGNLHSVVTSLRAKFYSPYLKPRLRFTLAVGPSLFLHTKTNLITQVGEDVRYQSGKTSSAIGGSLGAGVEIPVAERIALVLQGNYDAGFFRARIMQSGGLVLLTKLTL